MGVWSNARWAFWLEYIKLCSELIMKGPSNLIIFREISSTPTALALIDYIAIDISSMAEGTKSEQ